MRTSIATVCLMGTLDQKLVAAKEAGFDGVEIFEPDLIASPKSPEEIRARAQELGLSLDLYQPFRDFEGVGPDLLEQNLRRAAAKFSLMNRLGIETMLLCSNVATARSGDEQLAAAQLRELGVLAERFGVRVAYEALAWGKFVDDYEQAARIVRLADHPRIGVCLDSFHILSKGHDPQAIETIPAAKIFFVQLADAPILSMDVLSWSRHHRLFPGEGGFDLAAFMGHLVRTGYDGPVSLEIFNDTFRQSDPRATAIDARRSLRLLEDETLTWLGGSSGGRTEQMSARPLPAVEPPADINYVELRTGAIDDMRLLLEQLGFSSHGRHRSKSVELWSQGAARVVLGRPEPNQPPPTVAGIGLSVRNPATAFQRAIDLFATEIHRPEGPGDEPLVGVRAPDGSEVFFGREGETAPRWVREFGEPSNRGTGLIERVDHINLAQPWQHFDAGVLFFHSVLDLRSQPSMEVAAPVGLVRSQVLRAADGVVRIALNLVPSGANEDAILPQHIAFASSDVLALAREARERGFHPLDIPANYYDDIEARYDVHPELLNELKKLNVMYDRDETGEFLHFYTHPIGTVFLEVVERRDGYEGYGALNAPVRLAAQYQQRRATREVPA
ncbi:bifunctional sugar phosphate isomerase/epimerase/4-hydroxyphenylpyruvate dioxygenase family protein [Mycetocola zhadangensis]|uniref:3-dehydroshikimate dehydratase n=1 Tax=Mycetocola zhadangensis TaxID=1164595 RepID=A0A3L7IVW9_9MICO|nr:sugar phosphate isomerase/epimerase and 4-hydroxyphenylpyruvate domain-containing protein [Mycetocola zhadangensis]RLQ81142.1 sugar phosphate isomerase/epimerase and 4-hydroxyphenylpyruvate domain-containing protein [Mycetocola zhadangensis]GGF05151.1 4-hydroxyphenylpyruvate dioxygenase [Mycetocola zhadangensis]